MRAAGEKMKNTRAAGAPEMHFSQGFVLPRNPIFRNFRLRRANQVVTDHTGYIDDNPPPLSWKIQEISGPASKNHAFFKGNQ